MSVISIAKLREIENNKEDGMCKTIDFYYELVKQGFSENHAEKFSLERMGKRFKEDFSYIDFRLENW